MAASEEKYRNQHTLDIVFAVSSTLMLASIILMFWQDYFREFKTEQRSFRDVEATVAQRIALQQLPSKEQFDALEAKVKKAREGQDTKKIGEIKGEMAENQKKKERADAHYQDVKSAYDSLIATRNIDVDSAHGEHRDKLNAEYSEKIKKLTEKLDAAKAKRDEFDENLKDMQREMAKLTTPLTEAESEWKKLNDRFETQVKLAHQKQWRITDSIRDMPMLDEFASPLKIQQYTINDVPINFNFAYVRRFDRCVTCHEGIDRPTYTRAMLESLKNPLPADLRPKVDSFWNAVAATEPKDKPAEVNRLTRSDWAKQILSVFVAAADWNQVSASSLPQFDPNAIGSLKTSWEEIGAVAKVANVGKETITGYLTEKRKLLEAQGLLEARIKTLGPNEARNIPTPDELSIKYLPDSELTAARVMEFSSHPRLDLFVGANSKHPAERFGCTACHQGQGSATSFNGSFHTPNTTATKKAWTKEYGYGKDTHTFLWDFPMLPARFVESSCLKCHHQVTDLYSSDNRNEAPKLLKGFSLIRENGCFGCHEIQGRKGGRPIGPDLRLESNPPLEDLTPAEQAKVKSDVDNMPGTYRKVGPSLYRVSEKTNRDWTARWLKGPRDFRPDTKMPHFYGLANNDPKNLPPEQAKFPEAEIRSVSHYLFAASDEYLKELKELHNDGKAAADQQRLNELLNKPVLTPEEKAELADNDKTGAPGLRRRVRMRHSPLLVDQAKGHKGDPAAGRQLFSERGCLACHSHHGTDAAPMVSPTAPTFAPKIASEAQFGPNLSQLVAKLGKPGDKESARVWLIQWILDPHVHSPRSRMPVTHLTPEQAADVAAWLLSQQDELTDSWAKTEVGEPSAADLKKLAEVYFVRLLPADLMEKLLSGQGVGPTAYAALPVDEQKLNDKLKGSDPAQRPDMLKYYLGKKAVGRLGCFGCHDVPGFDTAKPIGVGLLDWGKKDPERLAFEDVAAFVKKHFNIVPSLKDKDDKPIGYEVKDGEKKAPYEEFFADSLFNHQREGFLNQKLEEPRSYDYNRLLAWDDRSRMPQFKFARSHMRKGEDKDQFEARELYDEAQSRQAVMTFILGLVADPIPLKSLNEPSGDRLAEVKGRQVLDKYNCAGCHVIQPGVFDFKVSKAGSILLDKSFDLSTHTDHVFANDYNWAGKTPVTPDRLAAQAVAPKLMSYRKKTLVEDGKLDPVDLHDAESVAEAQGDMLNVVSLRLGHALRFHSTKLQFVIEQRRRELNRPMEDQDPGLVEKLDKLLEKLQKENKAEGDLRDITASHFIRVPAADMIYPPPAVFDSPEGLHRRLADLGPYGGTFSDLLLGYLAAKTAKTSDFYKLDQQGDSNYARAAGPPSLLGQGARTQAAWLHQFLLNPHPVRRMTVLRMPKFNMSTEEAETLVKYFTGASRLQNTGVGLDYDQVIPQQQDLDSPYWKKKTADYVSRLKAEKNDKGKSLYDERMEFLQPFLDGKFDVPLAASKKRVAAAQDALDEAKKSLDKAKKDFEDAKDDAAKKKSVAEMEHKVATAEKFLADAKDNELEWKEMAYNQENGPKGPDRDAKLKAFDEKDAYVVDTYKMVTKICLQCHQVGKLGKTKYDPGEAQGPPLQQVHDRIRPGWAVHWIAAPPRMLPYAAVMPVNFEKGKKNWQEFMAGSSIEQVRAARDLLMILPRIEAMPINRYWALSLPGLAEKTEKK